MRKRELKFLENYWFERTVTAEAERDALQARLEKAERERNEAQAAAESAGKELEVERRLAESLYEDYTKAGGNQTLTGLRKNESFNYGLRARIAETKEAQS